MAFYIKKIEEEINKIPENRIIFASKLYQTKFSSIPETAYYKSLERLVDSGKLFHLTKGIYSRPKITKFGIIPISDNEILSSFIDDNHGVIVGYHLFNKYGITTQVSKKYEILTDIITENKKNICNVSLKKINFKLSENYIKSIEVLEILQGYSLLEDSNEKSLFSYIKDFVNTYSDSDMNYVLENRKYKKSTIASLKYFLDLFSVENTLGKYLSSLSCYKITKLEDDYEFAFK